MSAWTGKPCVQCGKKKGAKQKNYKFCFTCKRELDKARSKSQHAGALFKKYGITLEQYNELYELQGGRCYLCQFATGKRRRLTVDHDHACCDELPACGRCVRGLLCSGCNRNVLGWAARDKVEFFYRGIEYLTNPPFRAILEGNTNQPSGAINGDQRGRRAPSQRRNQRP